MPLAAHATVQGETLRIDAAWGDPEGSAALVQTRLSGVVGSLEQAAALGTQVAAQLRAAGAH